MRYFKKNQKVFCLSEGEGIVTDIVYDDSHPIKVEFKNGTTCEYTCLGQRERYTNVELSQRAIRPVHNKPLIDFNLSFTEAIIAAKEGKQVRCELWEEHQYLTYYENYLKKAIDFNIYVPLQIDDVLAKWCIVDRFPTKYFEKNDTVYSLTYGEGLVVCVDYNAELPITVQFYTHEQQIAFTYDGRYSKYKNKVLSKTPFESIDNILFPDSQFSLSFTEAMIELQKGNSVACENWNDPTTHLKIMYDKNIPMIRTILSNNRVVECHYHFNIADYKSDW